MHDERVVCRVGRRVAGAPARHDVWTQLKSLDRQTHTIAHLRPSLARSLLTLQLVTSRSSVIGRLEAIHYIQNNYTRGEVTSQSIRSRYDLHFVGITRHNA